jgi:phospholipid transport system substrate-binding protein
MTLRPFFLFFITFFLSLCMATLFAAEDAQPTSQSSTAPTHEEEVSPSPEAILQNGIAALTEQFKQGNSQKAMLAFLDEKIARYFDFDYMARLSAGFYWNGLKEEQRQTFVEYFRRAFFQALARQVSNFGNPQVLVYPSRPGTNLNEITVSARVTQPQGIPILMDFRFYRGDQGWKVFDVVADGSSAVLYYRRFYANLVGRYGINALLGAQ